MTINATKILLEITIIAAIEINTIAANISMLMIIVAINTTMILEELTIIATQITSYDPGDWVELLFVGARRLSGVGGGRQADHQRGR